MMSSVPHSLSCPLLGSSCVTGRSGRLDGHGPPEQEHAGVWTANPPGVTGQCGAHAGVCVCMRVCVSPEELEEKMPSEKTKLKDE